MIADNEALGPRITISIGNADDLVPPNALFVQFTSAKCFSSFVQELESFSIEKDNPLDMPPDV